MVKLALVQASNANIKTTFSSPAALFVGATSGIGESTLKLFVKNTEKPTIYLVGRSQNAATRIIKELETLNAGGTYNFIQSDVSLIANVDSVCDQIKSKEKKLDLIVLSPGYLTFEGRNGTSPSPL